MRRALLVFGAWTCLALIGCGGRAYVAPPGFDADSLAVDAQTAFGKGNVGQGIDLLTTSLNTNRGMDRLPAVAQNLNDLGVMTMTKGDYPQAQRYLEEAQELYGRLGDKQGMVSAKLNLISLRIKEGKVTSVMEELTPILDQAREAGAAGVEASIHNEMGRTLAQEKKFEEAVSHFEKAIELHRRRKSAQGESAGLHNLADVQLNLSKPEKAKELLDQAIAIDKDNQMWPSLGDDLYLQGAALEAMGDRGSALHLYERSFYVFRYTSAPRRMDAARDAITKLGGTPPPDAIPGKAPSKK